MFPSLVSIEVSEKIQLENFQRNPGEFQDKFKSPRVSMEVSKELQEFQNREVSEVSKEELLEHECVNLCEYKPYSQYTERSLVTPVDLMTHTIGSPWR